MFRSLMAAAGVCGLVLLLQPRGAEAGNLIINDGSTMTINSSNTLTMNCSNITVKTGGTLTNAGTVKELGTLTEESGSSYTNNGTVESCSGEVDKGGSFWPLKLPSGEFIILYF